MKTLYYVPVIHSEADFGRLGPALADALRGRSGRGRWEQHHAAVEGFWRSVEDYLLALEPPHLKVYQDGLPAGGSEGRRVIEEAARRGSRNHQLVLRLLDRGAVLMKTEEPALLIEEYERLARLAQGGPPAEAASPAPPQERLTSARDHAIASNIAATLQESETAVLFLGAAHDVSALLPPAITVRPVKERRQVLEYFHELLSGRDDERFAALARELAAPVLPQR